MEKVPLIGLVGWVVVSILAGLWYCAIAHFGGASRRPEPDCLCKRRVCTYDPDFGCGSKKPERE